MGWVDILLKKKKKRNHLKTETWKWDDYLLYEFYGMFTALVIVLMNEL